MILDHKGRVWGADGMSVIGLDPATGKYFQYDIPYAVKTKAGVNGYGEAVSGDGKVWFAERDVSRIGRLDPDSGKIDEFEPRSPIRSREEWARIGRATSGSDCIKPGSS